jgi:succinate-acetate transporter protein
MSTITSSRTERAPAAPEVELEVMPAVPVVAAPVGDPAMIGLPTFVLASIALGLALTGYLPTKAAAGALPVIMLCAGIGILGAMIWSVRLGASVLACVFGLFAAFWLSYATLVLGLTHNWFAIPTPDVSRTVSAFLLTWTIGIAVLTGVTLRLPRAFTALFLLVDIALLLVLLGNEQTSTTLTKAGGWVTFVFAGLGIYLFAGASAAATGSKAFPLGKPLLG